MRAITEGMRLARRTIFHSPTNIDEWHFNMLLAIETAKKMGAETFEITCDGVPRRPVQQPQGVGYIAYGAIQGDEWKNQQAAEKPTTVTVYALVVE